MDSMELYLYNDVPKALKEVKRILKPQGLYRAAFLGGDCAKDLRKRWIELESLYDHQASLKLIPTIRPEAITQLLQRISFKDIVVECMDVQIHYSSLQTMVRDIREAGENRLFSSKPHKYQRKFWQHVCDEWSEFMPLSLDIIFITARA
jgi:ubiquinone/menaquinone biosynthesis C-methylase UbiE